MKRLLLGCSLVLSATVGMYACSDATSPTRGLLTVPPRPSLYETAPPTAVVSVGPLYHNSATLYNFPFETWVTLSEDASSNAAFTSKPAAPGASPYYQTPGRTVTATGVYDGRNDTRCAMNLSVNNALVNGGNFGTCGGIVHDDTVKIVGGSNTISRGQVPYQNSYDCDIWGAMVCHAVSGSTVVTLRPIPVSLKKPTAFPPAVNFANTTTQITFTIRPDPGTFLLGGNLQTVTLAATSWQWQGADTTRAQPTCAVPSLAGPSRQCLFTPQESGRLTAKAFVGGYEQTNAVTVQCLMSPSDSAVNDTTSDFSLRSALRQAMEDADTAAAPGTGYDNILKRGLRHETGGKIWRLPNGGGLKGIEYDDPNATQCNYHQQRVDPPVPGATIESYFHTHSTSPGELYYGCFDSVKVDGLWVKQPRYLNDPNASPGVHHMVGPDRGGGSDPDWENVVMYLKSEYVIHKPDSTGNAYATKLATFVNPDNNPNVWPVTGPLAHKCTWVK